MGNPYPPYLEPVVLDYGMPGKRCSMRLVEEEIIRPGGIVSDYLYVEPDPKLPRLQLRLAPRGKHQTDEQYASYRRTIEEYNCAHAIYLGLCHLLCTLLGNHAACAEGLCRRNGRCSAIRDQDRFGIPLVLFPPCVPLDREIIETYRKELVAELKWIVARDKGERPNAEPATSDHRLPGPPRDGALAEANRHKPGGGTALERKAVAQSRLHAR